MALSKKDQYKLEHGELKIIDSGYADTKEDYEYYKTILERTGCKGC